MVALGHQLLIGHLVGLNDSLHGVMEDVGVVAVVESPLQFLKVAIQMLDADLVERADNRTLEQAPHALDSVSMDFADHPLLIGMLDRSMACIVVCNPNVGFQLVSVDCLCLILDVAPDEVMEGMATDVRDTLDPDLSGVSLDGPGHPGFTLFASRSYVALLAADQSFVYFHDSEQSRPLKRIIAHGFSDPVAQIPTCFSGNSKRPGQLPSRNPLAGFAHEVDRREPLAERQVGIVHDGSRSHGEVVSAPLAVPLVPVLNPGDIHISATGTGHATGPAQILKVVAA